LSIVKAAYTTTTKAGSARMHLSVQYKNMPASTSAAVPSIGGSGVVDFANQAGQFVMNIGPQSMTVRSVDHRIYLQLPPAARSQFGDKPWAEVDVNQLPQSARSSLGNANAGDSGAKLLQALRSVSGSVTRKGTAEVGGVSTTSYALNLQLKKVLAGISGVSGAALAQAHKAGLADTVPVVVDIDQQGRTRELQLTISIGNASIVETLTLDDFGVPVHVTPPPASQTANITSRFASPKSAGAISAARI
jgi:hypothetical protein